MTPKEDIQQTIKEIQQEHINDSVKIVGGNCIESKLTSTRKKESHCPECGCDVKVKESFKGRKHYRTKRRTQHCVACDWACILPTEREAFNHLGLLEDE